MKYAVTENVQKFFKQSLDAGNTPHSVTVLKVRRLTKFPFFTCPIHKTTSSLNAPNFSLAIKMLILFLCREAIELTECCEHICQISKHLNKLGLIKISSHFLSLPAKKLLNSVQIYKITDGPHDSHLALVWHKSTVFLTHFLTKRSKQSMIQITATNHVQNLHTNHQCFLQVWGQCSCCKIMLMKKAVDNHQVRNFFLINTTNPE